MQSLHAEMNLVSIKFEHSSDSMKTQLDIGNIAVDNTTPGGRSGGSEGGCLWVEGGREGKGR